MALNFRALLIPTAAIDSSGRAKPNAVFSVTPLAGGSAVPVFDAAEGGTALETAQIKTDALGNISGLYVAAPGAYILSFVGGGTVVTSAVMDSRDVATPGDLADAVALPAYTYIDAGGDPGQISHWLVRPGVTPGCAEFLGRAAHVRQDAPSDGVSAGTQANAELIGWGVENPEVAVVATEAGPHYFPGDLRVTEAGLYLLGLGLQATPGDALTVDGTESFLSVTLDGPTGATPSITLTGVGAQYGQVGTSCMPVLLHPDQGIRINCGSADFPWIYDVSLMIVRLN